MAIKIRDQKVTELYNRSVSNIQEGKFVSVKLTMLNSNDYNIHMQYFITETICNVISNPGLKIFDAKKRQMSNVIKIVKAPEKYYPAKTVIAHHIFEYLGCLSHY